MADTGMLEDDHALAAVERIWTTARTGPVYQERFMSVSQPTG